MPTDIDKRKIGQDAKLLKLHPKKFDLQHYSKGIRVGAFKLRFGRILPNDRIVHNFKYKVNKVVNRSLQNINFIFRKKFKIMEFVNSYLGMLKHCNSFNLKMVEMSKMYMVDELKKIFNFSNMCNKITIKKRYTELFYFLIKNRKKKRYTMYALWNINII